MRLPPRRGPHAALCGVRISGGIAERFDLDPVAVFWLSVLITGLVLFALAFEEIFGETLFVISVKIVTIPVISFGVFKLRRGVPE